MPSLGVRPITTLHGFHVSRLGAAWLGHATVLLRIGGEDGITVLTDPVFSERVGMSMGRVTLGPARLLPPALDVDHLPKIDVVLLSHAHFDHLDKPSLRRLAEGPARGATVITADRTRSLIPAGFGEVLQLGWGRHARLKELRLHAIRPRHWGARAAVDRRRGYNAYLLEYRGDRVLFGGDTAYTDAFDRIGAVDLSVLGIGAYEGWDGSHATPEQAWAMFVRHAAGERSRLLPMHHSTFDMGEKRVEEPIERLLEAAGPRSGQVVCRKVGDAWVCEGEGEQR
jgi:L-ascorbate metabolism protein UlaG (beta-lactamase superfamily)